MLYKTHLELETVGWFCPCWTWAFPPTYWVSFWWSPKKHRNFWCASQLYDRWRSRCKWVILNIQEPYLNSTLQFGCLIVYKSWRTFSFALIYATLPERITRGRRGHFCFLPCNFSLPSPGCFILFFYQGILRLTMLEWPVKTVDTLEPRIFFKYLQKQWK